MTNGIKGTPDLNSDITTPQEGSFIGGTYEEKGLRHPYTPVGVSSGCLTIKDTQDLRNGEKYFSSRILGTFLGLPDPAMISYEELNPQTGETVRDPQVVGYWDSKEGKVVAVEGRNLTVEAYELLRKWHQRDPEMKHFLREESPNIEQEQPHSGGIESEN